MSIRILIADDHRIMREGLCALLEKEPDLQIVGVAEDGRAAVRLVGQMKPDVVLMDIEMPKLNGVDATRRILRESTGVKVLILSMHTDRRFVTGVLNAGASGYLLKDCDFDELVNAIRTVEKNQVYLSPRIAGVVVDDCVQRGPGMDGTVFSTLTNREREVLQLIAEGNRTKSIASQLGVSVKTVEFHRQQTMRKLGLHSVADLVKYAIREGLTSAEL